MGYYIVVGVIGAIAGATAMFFVLRINRKYFNIEDILRMERDKLAVIGKDQLAALKKKIEEIL